MKYAFLFVLLAVSHASVLKAEIAVGLTVEWLSHEASLIALATPVDVQTSESTDQFRFTKCRYRLDEVIKGPQSVGDSVTIFHRGDRKPDPLELEKAREVGRQLLVFATTAEHLHKAVDGKYVFVDANGLGHASARFVDQAVGGLYTPEFQEITKFDDLLTRARKQALHESELKRQYRLGEVRRQSIEVPFDSQAFKQLYAGSACYLWVPQYIEQGGSGGKVNP